MLSSEQKKEAIRRHKEQKPAIGIFAVRCTASGRIWVGASRNLDATRNRTWFALRTEVAYDRSLQEEWQAHGEAAFRYEVLEKFEDDTPALAIPDLLKRRKAHWVSELNARELL